MVPHRGQADGAIDDGWFDSECAQEHDHFRRHRGLLGRGSVHPIGTGRYLNTTRLEAFQVPARRAGADVVWLFPPLPVVEVVRRSALRVAPMEA